MLVSSHHLFIGYENVVQMLIDKGVNVNAVDDEDRSALWYADKNGKLLNKLIQIF